MNPCTAQSSCVLVEYYYMTEFIISYHKSYSVHLHDRKKHKNSLTFNSKYNSKFASLQSFVISRSMAVPCLPYPILQSTTAFTKGSQMTGGGRRGDKLSVRWSIDGMILTGEKTKYWRKTCPIATLSITKLTRTDLKTNPGPPRQKTDD